MCSTPSDDRSTFGECGERAAAAGEGRHAPGEAVGHSGGEGTTTVGVAPRHHPPGVLQRRKSIAVARDGRHTFGQARRDVCRVAAALCVAPRHHRAEGEEGSEGPSTADDERHSPELLGDGRAVPTARSIAPGDNLAAGLNGGERSGVVCDARHALAQTVGDRGRVATAMCAAPGNNLASSPERRERVAVAHDGLHADAEAIGHGPGIATATRGAPRHHRTLLLDCRECIAAAHHRDDSLGETLLHGAVAAAAALRIAPGDHGQGRDIHNVQPRVFTKNSTLIERDRDWDEPEQVVAVRILLQHILMPQ
mmetsp:Transcript_47686/g.152310  ORF Transcript_47686/g.152310 Transcript_47686/m.152310 type:complete len:309 (-) Transcript_47686:83-1009(-)